MNSINRIAVIAACIGGLASVSLEREKVTENKDALIARWERAKAYTKEYLDIAPQDVYDFKPTPEMRSFGEQMLHLANGSYGLVNASTGVPSPYKFKDLENMPLKTKTEITNAVLASYDFVITTIRNMDESRFDSSVKIFNYEMTVNEGLDKAFEHQTHHRGQVTVYLRLKGIVPPHEKLF